MYSEELARKVLNAIYDSERSGRASITDAQRLSEQLGVDVHDIQDAFDILESEGRLRLHRVGDAGSIFRVELTGRGKKEILQPDSAGSGAEIPQPSTAVTSQPWRSEKEEPTTGRQYSLTCQREQARKMIFDRIEYGRELLRGLIPSISNTSELEEERQSYRKWSEYNAELLRRIFDDPSIAGQYSSIIRPIRRWEGTLAEKIDDLRLDIQERVNLLDQIEGKLDLIPEPIAVTTTEPAGVPSPIIGRRVFVVHGHNDLAKGATAGLLRKLDLKPIILHEQPNQGKTIIEKFEAYSDVGYAVVLLTPDDVGACGNQQNHLEPRARQNVIFELGFFIGKLGRSRVCALYQGDVEIPTDYQGVLYLPMDAGGGWRLELAKEIAAAGIDVDLNRLAAS